MYKWYTHLYAKKKAEIDGIKILLAGDVPVAHLVHQAMPLSKDLKYIVRHTLTIGVV